jgi:hypothetical protein
MSAKDISGSEHIGAFNFKIGRHYVAISRVFCPDPLILNDSGFLWQYLKDRKKKLIAVKPI